MGNASRFEQFPFNLAISKNPKRLREVLELRLLLEPEIAAGAAAHADDRDLRLLDAAVARQAEAVAAGREDPDLDTRFHQSLARASKNEVFTEVMAVIHDILAECRQMNLQSPDRAKRSLAAHQGVVRAVHARDADLARRRMRDHLEGVEGGILGDDGETPGA